MVHWERTGRGEDHREVFRRYAGRDDKGNAVTVEALVPLDAKLGARRPAGPGGPRRSAARRRRCCRPTFASSAPATGVAGRVGGVLRRVVRDSSTAAAPTCWSSRRSAPGMPRSPTASVPSATGRHGGGA